MTRHITDEQIFEAAEEHSNSSAGPVGETSDFWVFEREELLVFVHHVLALAEPAPAVPSIDYMALIDAALVRHKYAQGTRACVAFKHGAEWFREQALTAAPTPPAQPKCLT